jgi:hypothetical protein
MKNLIILGRSPFVNTVNLKNLKYDKLFINVFSELAKYVLSFDDTFKDQKISCEYIAPSTGYKFDKHIINFDKDKSNLLGFCYFSVTAAVNFAYLRGYQNVYLIGIDHNENIKCYKRNDGTVCHEINSELHRKAKEFIYKFNGKMNIFQTNPDTNWELKYIDVNRLYKRQGVKNGRNQRRTKEINY